MGSRGPQQQRRFPIEALMPIFDQRFPVLSDRTYGPTTPTPPTRFAEVMGLPQRTVKRWRLEGGLPESAADRVAALLGYHPASIWPDWFDDVDWSELDEEERYAEAV